MSFNNDYVPFHGENITTGLFAETMGWSRHFFLSEPDRLEIIEKFLKKCDPRSFLDRYREVRSRRREINSKNKVVDRNSQYKDAEFFRRTGVPTKAEPRKCMKCNRTFSSLKGRRLCNSCKIENENSVSSFMAEYV